MLIVEVLTYLRPPTPEARKDHQDYLKTLGSQGKLFMAGKYSDESGALVIWKVDSANEADKFAREDPYLNEKVATYVLKEWSPGFDYSRS